MRNLRKNYDKFHVLVESNLCCDMIVSQRCGMLKIKWSDIGNISNRQVITDKVLKARQFYPHLVILIEDDRDSSMAKNRTKHFDTMLFNLTEIATIMFTKHKSK